MVSFNKIWLVVIPLFILPSNLQRSFVNGEPQVPCFFIFGDSLADCGNNNPLPTLAKVNYSPYGIDFPKGPTGRFCNGRTQVDILAELLGFDDYIPPFAAAESNGILRGVNYASGSAGLLNATGKKMGENISMDKQLKNHRITVSRIINILGSRSLAQQHLNKCIYSVEMGSNDYINNYFIPQYYPSSRLYTPEQYASLLIKHYFRQIFTLYKYGARNVALVGLGEIGCTPNAISTYGTNGSACVDRMNAAVQLFNNKLKSLVYELNSNLTNAKFVYIGSYGKGSLEFKVTNAGCCHEVDGGLCRSSTIPCQNRTEYYFWDSFHPTEGANLIIAKQIYNNYYSKLLGFKDYTSSDTTASGQDIFKETNYVSGVAEIREATGHVLDKAES